MLDKMNYFAYRTAAERYAMARPYFHPLVMEKVAAHWLKRIPFARALDVGCGTGMSTRALLLIADQAIGTDISPEMLAQTEQNPRIQFVQAPAEKLPFASHNFDLITSCMAFHWFDQPRFLREAARLLKKDAPLLIYGHGFAGAMQGNPDFAEWNDQIYLQQYPNPPRQSMSASQQLLQQAGWLHETEAFSHTIPMSLEQLAHYLLTQSNVIVQVEQGQQTAEAVCEWLEDSLRPFFRQPFEQMQFRGHIWYCRVP
jgi:ubiquinone/menaquinone biosynthesis C-methylase UbiE